MHDLAQAIFESYPSTIRGDLAPSTPEEQHTFSPNLRHHGESTNLYFRDYQPLEVMLPWMRLLTSLFPTHVRMVNIGVSYEGRNITALRVGVHPTNSEKPAMQRKTIIVAGGSHAREWISTSTVSYIAYSFITGYGKSRTITKQIEEYDWIFIPTLNPDGYVYTWETDRLWRKNRQRTALQFCQGVDLDRAYGFEWDNASSKNNPCSESFSGEGPFEAVESRRFADWVRNETENNNSHFVGFLDLHSYSQQVLYPYSYSCASAPPSLENLEELAIGLAKAIRLTNGNNYGVTSACEGSVFVSTSQKTLTASKSKQRHQEGWPQMETGGGSALDWFYHDLNVRYSYQIKLRDTGSYGFLLPSSNIVSTGEEALSAVQYFGQFLLGNNGIEASANTSVTKDELNSNEQQQQQTRLTRESSEEPKMLVNEGSARWKTEGEKEEEEQEEEDRERTDEGSKSRWDLRKRRR